MHTRRSFPPAPPRSRVPAPHVARPATRPWVTGDGCGRGRVICRSERRGAISTSARCSGGPAPHRARGRWRERGSAVGSLPYLEPSAASPRAYPSHAIRGGPERPAAWTSRGRGCRAAARGPQHWHLRAATRAHGGVAAQPGEDRRVADDPPAPVLSGCADPQGGDDRTGSHASRRRRAVRGPRGVPTHRRGRSRRGGDPRNSYPTLWRLGRCRWWSDAHDDAHPVP